MKRIGLIREKRDIEYLILYTMTFLQFPVRYEDLADMAICDGGFGYFEFSDAMAELLELGHIRVTEQDGVQLYDLTESGMLAADAFSRRLPVPVRLEASASAARVNAKLCLTASIRSSRGVREDGTKFVKLSMLDNHVELFSFEMLVANEEQAQLYEKNFRAHAMQMFDGMICVLTNDYGGFPDDNVPNDDEVR